MKKVDTKQWLVLFSLVLLALIAGIKIMQNIEQEKDIFNYSKIETIENILNEGEEIKDRDTYYTLQQIIKKYINSYLVEEDPLNKNTDTVNYLEYYNVLAHRYKKYLGKNGYKERAEKFLEKFHIYVVAEIETINEMDDRVNIESIHKFYNEPSYICKIRSQEDSNNIGYIGITLDESHSCFYIFYLE